MDTDSGHGDRETDGTAERAQAGEAQPDSGASFRPDVEGLRGVAILLVLLFHAALPIPGGFVGVDVFLVISGFLITGLLLRERETTGRIGLIAFYGRRIRRLLPAAAVVIAVVMPLAFVALPPLDRPSAMTDGGAAVLCVSNIRSAMGAGDYFAAVATPSPFLHFWSLSLEEQFYLVWPVLLLTAARCRRARLAVGITLLVLLVVESRGIGRPDGDRADLELLLAALSQLAVRGGRAAGRRLGAASTTARPGWSGLPAGPVLPDSRSLRSPSTAVPRIPACWPSCRPAPPLS